MFLYPAPGVSEPYRFSHPTIRHWFSDYIMKSVFEIMIILFLSRLSEYHLATSFLGPLWFFAPTRMRKTDANFSETEGETP